MRLKRFFLFGILFFTAVTGFSQKDLNWLNGTWTGKGYQVDDQTWTIEYVFDSEKAISYIKYPSMNCEGQWKFVKEDDCVYIFLEKISYGDCDNDVHVYITRIDENHLSVAYFLPAYMKDVVAYAVLTKKE